MHRAASLTKPARVVAVTRAAVVRAAAAGASVAVLSACGSPSAEDIARALENDGAKASDAQCIADQAVSSDLSTDTLDRLAEEGITDDNGEDVQYLEDDSAILQALVVACLQ